MNNQAIKEEHSDLLAGGNYDQAQGNLNTQIFYGFVKGYDCGIVEVYLGEGADYGNPPVAEVELQEGQDPSLLAAAFAAYTQGYADCLTEHPDVPESYDIANLCQDELRYLARHPSIPLRPGQEFHFCSRIGEKHFAVINSCCGSITLNLPNDEEEFRKCARFELEAAKFEAYVLGYTDALHSHDLSHSVEPLARRIFKGALEEAAAFPVDSHTV